VITNVVLNQITMDLQWR